MDRPHATRDRVTADAARRSAAEHAQRAAHLARRGAAARRRALLTLVLIVGAAAGWSVVGLAGATLLAGAVPTIALGTVLVLGRRAVVSAARSDLEWGAGAATRAPLAASSRRTGAVGRAVRPSDATTEVMARITAQRPVAPQSPVTAPATDQETAATPAEGKTSQVQRRDDGPDVGSGTWAPVPVPRPAYTLKPAARRAEPAPLVLDQPGARTAQAAAEVAGTASGDGETAEGLLAPASPIADATGSAASAQPGVAPDEATVPRAGLDLDAILARRRASGE